MKKELKQAWVAALRSGQYKQAHGFLEVVKADGTVQGNCCLGVLCRLTNVPAAPARASHTDACNTVFVIPFGDPMGLPQAIASSTQMPSNGVFEKCGLPRSVALDLAEMNDGTGICRKRHSFNEIADYIDRHVLEDA